MTRGITLGLILTLALPVTAFAQGARQAAAVAQQLSEAAQATRVDPGLVMILEAVIASGAQHPSNIAHDLGHSAAYQTPEAKAFLQRYQNWHVGEGDKELIKSVGVDQLPGALRAMHVPEEVLSVEHRTVGGRCDTYLSMSDGTPFALASGVEAALAAGGFPDLGIPLDVMAQRTRAAKAAAGLVQRGDYVGLGTGRTATAVVKAIAKRIETGELDDITAVATSEATEDLARELGINVISRAELVAQGKFLDITIDGADTVVPDLDVIKGGGGAMTMELAVRQRTLLNPDGIYVLVVDNQKLVPHMLPEGSGEPGELLGFPNVPVEVLTNFRPEMIAQIESAFGAEVTVRQVRDGSGDFVSDSGQTILDVRFGEETLALMETQEGRAQVAAQLKGMTGVIQHGIFLGEADLVMVGTEDGRVVALHRNESKAVTAEPQTYVFGGQENLAASGEPAQWEPVQSQVEVQKLQGNQLLVSVAGEVYVLYPTPDSNTYQTESGFLMRGPGATLTLKDGVPVDLVLDGGGRSPEARFTGSNNGISPE